MKKRSKERIKIVNRSLIKVKRQEKERKWRECQSVQTFHYSRINTMTYFYIYKFFFFVLSS